jgi:hypothetical protein
MTDQYIVNTRLKSQQIADKKFDKPSEIVNWMGAMQAQDFEMAQWAIGLRVQNGNEKEIHEAIDAAKIIRTHLLRPTWHFVSGEDIYWMLELTGPRIRAGMKGRHQQLELSEKVLKKANSVIEKNLANGNHLTRKELVTELQKAKIQTDNNRSSHIFLSAELEGIICSGKMKGKQPTYALLPDRVPQKKLLHKEEALCKLATKYFQSHAPATLHDFLWWSGLSVTDARKAVESVKEKFVAEKIKGIEYLFADLQASSPKRQNSFFLLPAFDEFLISYKDRSSSIISDHESKAFSKNGIFWPTIIVNGKVAGTWKREIKKEKVIITPNFFNAKNRYANTALKKEAQRFGNFLNRKTELLFCDQK